MAKLTTFFYVLRRTFTSPLYYSDILKAPLSFSFKFFYTFFFLYSIIFATWITVTYLLPLSDLISFLPEKLIQAYPSELEIKIKDGEVSTNVPEPYRIPLSFVEDVFKDFEKRTLGESTEKIENLVVIDTNASIEDFVQYQTYLLLTKKHLVYLNDDGNLEVVKLQDIGEVTIDQQLVIKGVGMLRPFLKFILPSLIGLTFVGIFVFTTSAKMFYLLLLAVVFYILSKLISFQVSYLKAFQVGLHLVVISTTFFSLLPMVGLSLSFPFLQTILLSILWLIILSQIKAQPVRQLQPIPPSSTT